MSSFGNISDEIIKRAMQKGAFDDLPGKGKPLNLDENPYESEEWRTAFRILRSNGYSLPWLEMRKEIEEEIDQARSDALSVWQSGRKDLWVEQIKVYEERIKALNERIFKYNLQVPSAQFQRQPLNQAREIENIQQCNSSSSTPPGGN